MRNSLICFIICLLVIPFFTGCYSSKALKKFPDYIDNKEKISSISLFSDIIVYNDGWEDGSIVNIPFSIQLSDSILKKLNEVLIKKNYTIKEIYPPTVGYFKTQDTIKYKVYESTLDYDKDIDSLKIISPPFYLQNLPSDSTLKLIFKKNKNYSDSNVVRDSNLVYSSNARECIFVFHLEGNNVSVGKSLGIGLLTAVLTLGTVSIYPVSNITAYYWLIDANTGETILGDSRYLKGENIDEDNINDILLDFVKIIPPKKL